jgi:hypothetical protein
LATELKGRMIGGKGKVAEIDGGNFGGYVKPANKREDRRDRRFTENQSGKRKVVVVIRGRGGNTLPLRQPGAVSLVTRPVTPVQHRQGPV